MKIGLYSITYRGIWYKGPALDLPSFLRRASREGWEGVELDTERPHAAPMDLSSEDRRRLRDLAVELNLPIAAVSPNCDLSSPIPSQREAMICYTRECIKLTRDLGAPICKIFAAWRGITLHDGLASYDQTYSHDPYPCWREDRRGFVVDALRELTKLAEDCGVVLALQNHGPDIVNNYKDSLALIHEIDSPAFKACMDINIEDQPESEAHAWDVVKATGPLLVHSHLNGEFQRDVDGVVRLVGAGYFDKGFWGRQVVYPAYVDALVAGGYEGYLNWEYCHPGVVNGVPADIDYVHEQTLMALEYMRNLRARAQSRLVEPALKK